MNLERRGVEARIVPNREGGLALDDAVEFLTGCRTDLKRMSN